MSKIEGLTTLAPATKPGVVDIKICNPTDAEIEEKMLSACLTRAARFIANGKVVQVEIIISARVPRDAPAYRHPGWLEYVIYVSYVDLNAMEVHAIQRRKDQEIEFCS